MELIDKGKTTLLSKQGNYPQHFNFSQISDLSSWPNWSCFHFFQNDLFHFFKNDILKLGIVKKPPRETNCSRNHDYISIIQQQKQCIRTKLFGKKSFFKDWIKSFLPLPMWNLLNLRLGVLVPDGPSSSVQERLARGDDLAYRSSSTSESLAAYFSCVNSCWIQRHSFHS